MKRWLVITFSVLIIVGASLAGWLWHQKTQSPAGTPSGAHVLSYANAGLSSVGADIYNQTNATQLDLSHNSLRS
ncbi:MAG TPA: hypothetical protein VFT53_06120, partial [Candidatus Saccharimonadales bacterium]|nr:hypothetical protein [Candidatus Saccharimonadales bacterium]